MNASDIANFKYHLEREDPENREARRVFFENYEWLDGYITKKWKSKKNFYSQLGEFYFERDSEIPKLAEEIGLLGPIVSSKSNDYKPTKDVSLATILLQSDNGSPAERFGAMMILVKQIRNNLFHGMKMELSERDIYERNKNLVMLGGKITAVILAYLEEAEIWIEISK